MNKGPFRLSSNTYALQDLGYWLLEGILAQNVILSRGFPFVWEKGGDKGQM